MKYASADRLIWLYQAIYQGFPTERIYELSGIDPWFIENLKAIVENQECFKPSLSAVTPEQLRQLKSQGYGDQQIAQLTGQDPEEIQTHRESLGIRPVYKSVDTCAGEFDAYTPYYYSTYDSGENEAPQHEEGSLNKRVVILGGGPNRIGQGIEFDYCCVHAAMTLRRLGYEPIMVCLLYTSPSPRDLSTSRMPSSA